ncbi:MAG: TolC family protein [Bacteroidetes bacterium]|nr:TolC family protein [Bacteroidota bacterium]
MRFLFNILRPGAIIILFIIVNPMVSASQSGGTMPLMLKGDTLVYTLPQFEKQFLDSNLLLLSQKYNITENEAYIKQAKIWDQPVMNFEHVLYNPQRKTFFEIGDSSEASAQVQQLIMIGSKRSKLVSMARTTAEIAKYQYFDLMRSLKVQLRSAFYNTYYLIEQIRVYDTEISRLKEIVKGYDQLYPKGLIALKEVVRIKALLLSMESERLDIHARLFENQNILKVLINDKTTHFILPVPDQEAYHNFNPGRYTLQALADTASKNRYDLMIYEQKMKYAETDLVYQRLFNIPDPTVSLGWDQNGSFVHNYNYIGLSFNMPFWDRNRGNIIAARSRIAETQADYRNYSVQLVNDLAESFGKLSEIDRVYRSIDAGFSDDFNRIIQKAGESYLKREIGLLEFVDLYESYKESRLQFLQLENDRINAIENLNYVVGRNIKW